MADIITFDPAYFQELSKNMGDVSKSLGDAKASLQKANVSLDSGLVAFALCSKLNDDMKAMKKAADAKIAEVNGYSKALTGGITRVNDWEATTKNRESGLAAQLGKTWGFEGGAFKQETPAIKSGYRRIENGEELTKVIDIRYKTRVEPGGTFVEYETPSGTTGGDAAGVAPAAPMPNESGGFVMKDENYYRTQYAGNERNCKAFVNAAIKGELGVNVPNYTDNLYELQGQMPIENGQVIYDPSNPLTEDDIKKLFSNAKVGDVIQMRWTYGMQTQHTAIFNGFDSEGNVQFLESNVDPTGNGNPNISVHSYSYSKLKNLFSHAGNGASIYRMGEFERAVERHA